MKRGQAAMEFLMTYGWALLVVIAAVGSLAFFGVLNPGKFLPESCLLPIGFACDDFQVSGSTTTINGLRMTPINGIGKSLDLFMIVVDKKGDEDLCGGYMGYVVDGTGGVFKPGEIALLRNPAFAGGLQCNTLTSHGVNWGSCCGQSNVFLEATNPGSTICGGGSFNLCPDGISAVGCPGPACDACKAAGDGCSENSPFDNIGKQGNMNLLVFYREQGSSIIHKGFGEVKTTVQPN